MTGDPATLVAAAAQANQESLALALALSLALVLIREIERGAIIRSNAALRWLIQTVGVLPLAWRSVARPLHWGDRGAGKRYGDDSEIIRLHYGRDLRNPMQTKAHAAPAVDGLQSQANAAL